MLKAEGRSQSLNGATNMEHYFIYIHRYIHKYICDNKFVEFATLKKVKKLKPLKEGLKETKTSWSTSLTT